MLFQAEVYRPAKAELRSAARRAAEVSGQLSRPRQLRAPSIGRGSCPRQTLLMQAGYGYRGDIEQVITHKIMPASPRGSDNSDRSVCNWLAVVG